MRLPESIKKRPLIWGCLVLLGAQIVAMAAMAHPPLKRRPEITEPPGDLVEAEREPAPDREEAKTPWQAFSMPELPEPTLLGPDESYDPKRATALSAFPLEIGAGIGLIAVAVNQIFDLEQPWLLYGGLGVAGASILVFPSLGHFYVDNTAYAWLSMAARAGMLGAAVTSRLVRDQVGLPGLTNTLTVLFAIGAGVLAVKDVVAASQAAIEANVQRGFPPYGGTWTARRQKPSIAVVPTLAPTAERTVQLGVTVLGRF